MSTDLQIRNSQMRLFAFFLTFQMVVVLSLIFYPNHIMAKTNSTKGSKTKSVKVSKIKKKKREVAQVIKKDRRTIDLRRSVQIQYEESSWNKNSTLVEAASVIVKDTKTGRLVRVQLTETGTDSGVYSGTYSIGWKEIQSRNPEIFAVPPEKQNEKIEAKGLKDLKRLPYIFRTDKTEQIVEVFSTREKAEAAFQNHRAQQEKKLKKSDDIPESLIETVENKEKSDALKKLDESIKLREGERAQLLTKLENAISIARGQFSNLSKKIQSARIKAAKGVVGQAMAHFQANQFEPAETLFKKAIDIDPTNNDAYYYLGVTHYKRDQFNNSLVYLAVSKPGQFNPVERDFFKGLNYFRLDENGNAQKTFEAIKIGKDKVFGPTAAFYEGLVKMKLEKYDEAKDLFQEVLDTSSDPTLDQSAEDYIEKIEKLKAFLKLKSKKFFFSASGGMQFDSNVLTVSSSSPNSGDPSRSGDYRYLSGLSVEYRPLYSDNHEFSLKTKGDLIYSSKGDNVAADPLMYSIKSPYKYKGTLFGKAYKLELAPGYEALHLDEDRSGATGGYFSSFTEKQGYLKSVTFDALNNLVIGDNHIMGANIKLRQDSSESKTAIGDNEPSAKKWALNWQNIFFLNDKKNLGIIGDLTYSINTAVGRNLSFQRYDVSAMSLFPLPYDVQGVGGLAYYQASYPDKVQSNGTPQSRTDNNFTFNLILIRPLTEWLNITLGGNYSDNQSNLAANTYSKYVLMTVLTASWSL